MAGPPLDDGSGSSAVSPPLREPTRPEQRPALWAEAVRRAGIPSKGAIDDTIASGDRDRLRDLARRLVAAAEQLREEPDPKGQRERSAQLRLALLVDADGARSAQAATFVEGSLQSDLVGIGRQLARIGDRVPVSLGPLDFGSFIKGWRSVWLTDPDGLVVEVSEGYRDPDPDELADGHVH